MNRINPELRGSIQTLQGWLLQNPGGNVEFLKDRQYAIMQKLFRPALTAIVIINATSLRVVRLNTAQIQ